MPPVSVRPLVVLVALLLRYRLRDILHVKQDDGDQASKTRLVYIHLGIEPIDRGRRHRSKTMLVNRTHSRRGKKNSQSRNDMYTHDDPRRDLVASWRKIIKGQLTRSTF